MFILFLYLIEGLRNIGLEELQIKILHSLSPWVFRAQDKLDFSELFADPDESQQGGVGGDSHAVPRFVGDQAFG